jgi:hypothetical protein
MNSPGLLTLVSDAASAGLQSADRWLTGSHVREAREVQVSGEVLAKGHFSGLNPFRFPKLYFLPFYKLF